MTKIGGYVTIVDMPDRAPTDAEMFERLHTVAFHHAEMRREIGFERAIGKIAMETWHDTIVPACYRARVAEIALAVFDKFKGRKYSETLLEAFINELRAAIFRHLEPIEPPIRFHRTHDEWPS